jgi:hypothetical protein
MKVDKYSIDIKMRRTWSYKKSIDGSTGKTSTVENEYKLTKGEFKRLIKFLDNLKNPECSCGCGQKIKLESFDLEN